MLNYQELNQKFSNKLNNFDEKQLLKWVEFDQYRDAISKLGGGETVSLKNPTLLRRRKTA